MKRNFLLLAAMLLLSTSGYAAATDRDDAIYAEVKRFWITQLDGGESAVIEKVKACYFLQTKTQIKSLHEANKCIIWDTALAGLSKATSKNLSEMTGKPAESLQTPYAKEGNMQLRAMKLLSRYWIDGDAATKNLNEIRNRVLVDYGRAYNDAMKDSGI